MILVNFLRYSYAVLAGLGLVCELVPWTREALIRYGRTMTKPDDDATKDKDKQAAAARANASPSRLSAAMIHYAAWKVPKSLFTHFYIVGAIVSGLLTIDTIAWFNSQSEFQHTGAAPHHFIPRILAFEQWLAGSIQSDVHDVRPDRLAVLALALFTLHVLLRLKESAYDQPATSAKMHASQYSVGVVFYILAPLGVVVDSYQAPGWKPQSPWLVVAGVAVYVYAFIHQRRCHGILFQLRNRCLSKQSDELADRNAGSGSSARTDTYAIPTGDLFEYVSCPHYLCEILIYISLWMVTACQATTLLGVLGWTIANLGITAHESQKWYRAKFGARYPRGRRALVPFVW